MRFTAMKKHFMRSITSEARFLVEEENEERQIYHYIFRKVYTLAWRGFSDKRLSPEQKQFFKPYIGD